MSFRWFIPPYLLYIRARVQKMSHRGGKLAYGLPPDITRLLYNNDPRVDYQVAEITSSLGIARSLKSELASQVTEMRMNLLRLEREELHAARHIERCEFALAPIRRIPTEILGQIFLCYVDLLSDKTVCVDVKGGVWILGHICSYWRAVALSTPQLWTTCAFYCGTRQLNDAPALVGAWFERARERPLSIRFRCDAIQFHPPPPIQVQETTWQAVFAIFLAHCGQWKEAELTAPADLFERMEAARNNLPILQRLDLCIAPYGETSRISTFSVAPRLQDVSFIVVGPEPPRVLLPWLQLKSYKGTSSPSGVSHILSDAPKIVDCTLYEGDDQPPPSDPPLVHRLRNLHLTNCGPTPEFLILPALQSLRFPASDIELLPSLERLLQRSMAAPTSLHIDDFTLSSELMTVLAAAPTITDLTMQCDGRQSIDVTNGFFDSFMDGGSIAPLLPALRRLSMQGLAFGESMVRMLEARCPTVDREGIDENPNKWEGARIESLTIADVHNTHIAHLLRIKQLEAGAGLKLSAESLSAVRCVHHSSL